MYRILILLLIVCVSCKSTYKTTEQKVSQDIVNFTYVSPVYNYEKTDKTVRFFKKYKSYTTKKIDTLFESKGKTPSNLVLNGKESDIKSIFQIAKKNEPIKLSNTLKVALENTKEQYVAFTLLEPKIENKSRVKSCKLEMVIIDVATSKVLFYGEFVSNIGGYSNQVDKSFKRVYRMLE